MDDDEELLLTQSLPSTPRQVKKDQQQELLLLNCDQTEISTTDNTFYLPLNPTIKYSLTPPRPIPVHNHTLFFLQDNESSQQDEIFPNSVKYMTSSSPQVHPTTSNPLGYGDLIAKLEMVLQIIKQKERKKQKWWVQKSRERPHYMQAIKKFNSPQLQRQQPHNVSEISISHKRTHSLMRKTLTEPSQRQFFTNRTKEKERKIDKYMTSRIINEEIQRQNPPLKTKRNGEPLRTKKEFLASIANWQEKKVLKQKERMEREKELVMAGVTFTPEINARSKFLMKKKGQMLPIYQREVRPKIDSNYFQSKPNAQKTKK